MPPHYHILYAWFSSCASGSINDITIRLRSCTLVEELRPGGGAAPWWRSCALVSCALVEELRPGGGAAPWWRSCALDEELSYALVSCAPVEELRSTI